MVALKVKSGKFFDFYALEEGGKCQLLEFMDDMQQHNPREFAKLIKDFDRTADNGLIKNLEKFKLLDGDIYEIRTCGGVRVLCFLDCWSIVVLTNGFMKKKQDEPDVQRALNFKLKYQDAKLNGYLTYRDETL